MIPKIASNLVNLKREFQKTYAGKSHIQEVVPASGSELFPIDRHDLELLHEFAGKNPMCYNSYQATIGSVCCTVYESDANKYWLSSITHEASRAPFSPTWLVSAYVLSGLARDSGFREVVDVGSGDGRIAFCAKLLGMQAFSIELDCMLAELQEQLACILDFHPHCSDAATFDYDSLGLESPVFAIGGIAQMGGSSLADAVIKKIGPGPKHARTGWILAGTYSQKYGPDPKGRAGWGTFIEKNNLRVLQTVSLPTAWTAHEPDETPYVLAASG